MFRDNGFRKSAPLEEGQELEVTIEAVGEKGDGIAKSKGFVIFVPGVKQGDNVKVRVTKVLRNFSFGEVVGPATGGSKKKKSETEEGQEEEGMKDEDMTTKTYGDEEGDDFGGDDDEEEQEEDDSGEE